jgi:hypothetical protein
MGAKVGGYRWRGKREAVIFGRGSVSGGGGAVNGGFAGIYALWTGYVVNGEAAAVIGEVMREGNKKRLRCRSLSFL